MLRTLLAYIPAAALAVATPALADSTTGTVVAYDRVSGVIVLKDRTVWQIGKFADKIPEGLEAGDVILIDFRSDADNGFGAINSVTVQE